MNIKELVKVMGCIITLYVICFLILPIIYTNFYPVSNEAYIIFFVVNSIFFIISMIFFTNKIKYYIIADIIYMLLITIYSGGSYGIGISGIELDGLHSTVQTSGDFLGATIAIVLVLVIQFVIKGLVTILKKEK